MKLFCLGMDSFMRSLGCGSCSPSPITLRSTNHRLGHGMNMVLCIAMQRPRLGESHFVFNVFRVRSHQKALIGLRISSRTMSASFTAICARPLSAVSMARNPTNALLGKWPSNALVDGHLGAYALAAAAPAPPACMSHPRIWGCAKTPQID